MCQNFDMVRCKQTHHLWHASDSKSFKVDRSTVLIFFKTESQIFKVTSVQQPITFNELKTTFIQKFDGFSFKYKKLQYIFIQEMNFENALTSQICSDYFIGFLPKLYNYSKSYNPKTAFYNETHC